MSAIAGFYQSECKWDAAEQGSRLLQALSKFPADDVQGWHQEQVFLGCHAQWITSESVGERNPYYDADRQLAITADAIIDNRDELFEALQVEAPRRKLMTDPQLILLAYAKWGEAAPAHLVGDFAFMLWDERERKLFGARDFSGSRTLYYRRDEACFAFCTTMEPLSRQFHPTNDINEHWIAEFLANPGLIETVDETSTVLSKVHQIPPSHVFSLQAGELKMTRYYKIKSTESLRLKSDWDYEEAFLEVYQKAVKARLRTHLGVGAFLSGGLDSGSVVSIAARELRHENKQLHTYSYVPIEGYVDWTPKSKAADERPYIQATVKHVGNIVDHYVDFQGKSALTEVDDWLTMLEMPYKVFENSYWIHGVHENARQQGVGILLSGARGNLSVSWGSPFSYYATMLKRMNWAGLYREVHQYSRNTGAARSRVMKAVLQKAFPQLRRNRGTASLYQYPTIIHPEFAQRTNVNEKLQEHGIDVTGFSSPPNIYKARRQHFQSSNTWNVNGICGTKMSLRNAVWTRDPTNDERVIQFCLSIPEGQFVQGGMDRALIRRATKGLLPDQVRLNQRVRGVQGADGIQRMLPAWSAFLGELKQMRGDPRFVSYINVPIIDQAIERLQGDVLMKSPFDADYCVLMRCLILYRYITRTIEGR